MLNQKFSVVAVAVLASLLTACGGGGSDGNQSGGGDLPPPPPPPPVIEADMVTSVPAPTYASGSEELAAFNYLNAERVRCGFGALKQDASLDKAARAHADWMIFNRTYGHSETPDKPNFFTGVTPADRMAAAGYSGSGNEIIGFGIYADKTGRGVRDVKELLATPYHGFGGLNPARDVGISVRSPLDFGMTGEITATLMKLGTSTTTQTLGTSDVVTYPCNGTSGVDYKMGPEIPSPVPGRNLSAQPLGHAINVMVRVGNRLEIDSAQLVQISTATPIPLRAPVTFANDVHRMYPQWAGYVIPDVALSPDTEYEVLINGKNEGAAFSVRFRFATGADASLVGTSVPL